jgi:hypothetical protein
MNGDRFPQFWQLAQAYFHQDWPEVSGPTWQDVVDGWRRDHADDEADALLAEIDEMLSGMNEDEIRQVLLAADLNYHREPGASRSWLVDVRDRLSDAS